jgi:sugar lactone lactonase YvrE
MDSLVGSSVCSYPIKTFAGTGSGGYNGDGMAATSSTLLYPYQTAFDQSNNAYVVDYQNHRIRMISAGTGLVSTVVGTGSAMSCAGATGACADGISASSASLYYPQGILIDASNNIYVADTSHHRIRYVSATNMIITSVAGNFVAGSAGDGGAATSANLYNPFGLAMDSSSNLYIGDYSNNKVRKVSTPTSGGIITTFAGTGSVGTTGDGGAATSALLSPVNGISIDPIGGNLLIATPASNSIRMVNLATRIMSTLVGSGTKPLFPQKTGQSAFLNSPYCVSVDKIGKVYICDGGNNRIIVLPNSTTTTASIFVGVSSTTGSSGDGGPASAAQLNWPAHVSFDSSGNVYITDRYNHKVRSVTSKYIMSFCCVDFKKFNILLHSELHMN